MKLRLDPGRLRLRLSPPEIDRFGNGEEIEATVAITDQRLVYRLRAAVGCDEPRVLLRAEEGGTVLELRLDPRQADSLRQHVAVEGVVSGSAGTLAVVVEQDFRKGRH